MAVLHLQFDVDSEVHPELYEMLASIGSSRLQAERLRQLAATGLVWERLRLQAYGRFEVPDLGPQAPNTSSAPALAVAPAADAGASSPVLITADAGPPASLVPQVVDAEAAVQGGDLPDFVDLSDAALLPDLARLPDLGDADLGPVDARPAEHADDQHAVTSAESSDNPLHIAPAPVLQPTGDEQHRPYLEIHEIRSAVLALPVLTEVLDTAELANVHAMAAANGAPPTGAEAARGTLSPGAQVHELVPVSKTAPRSRLMRMKEKGLFKNE
ncbi:MAG TPA: hypothetical protein VK439_07965 [Rubrivivax sp.]|nr:hypothetical protein [Rubrivivax sp.]